MNKIKIPINTTWSNCELIYHADEDIVCSNFLSSQFKTLWDRYISSIGGIVPKYNVWFDHDTKMLFGSDKNWINSTPSMSSFISRKEIFETKFCKFNLPSKMVNFYNSKPVFFKNFHNMKGECYFDFKIKTSKKILVFSGGPSSREYFNRINIENYSSIITCNHFYKSDLLTDEMISKIDYAIIGREVDLSKNNSEFYDYLKKSNTKFLIEVVDDGSIEYDMHRVSQLRESHPDRLGLFVPRYRSKIGTSPRLIVLASSMNPNFVDIIGMDGMTKETKRGDLHNHAFQINKKYNQTSANYNLYKRNYVELWDYMINCISNNGKITFRNLGEGHRCNQSTEITRSLIISEK